MSFMNGEWRESCADCVQYREKIRKLEARIARVEAVALSLEHADGRMSDYETIQRNVPIVEQLRAALKETA